MWLPNKVKISLVYFILLLSSCGPTKVNIGYDPIDKVTIIPRAETVVVELKVEDKRAYKEYIGVDTLKKPSMVAKNNPILVIENAVKSELNRTGFIIGKGNVIVTIELLKLYSEHLGFSHGLINSLSITVNNYKGKEYYQNNIIERDRYSYWTRKSVDKAFKKVISRSIHRLIEDKNFTDAIIEASKN